MKDLFIAEKPSVAAQFAEALGVTARKSNGFIEDEGHIVTWCVGHLVKLSYPEKYDIKLKGGVIRRCLFCLRNLNTKLSKTSKRSSIR